MPAALVRMTPAGGWVIPVKVGDWEWHATQRWPTMDLTLSSVTGPVTGGRAWTCGAVHSATTPRRTAAAAMHGHEETPRCLRLKKCRIRTPAAPIRARIAQACGWPYVAE